MRECQVLGQSLKLSSLQLPRCSWGNTVYYLLDSVGTWDKVFGDWDSVRDFLDTDEISRIDRICVPELVALANTNSSPYQYGPSIRLHSSEVVGL